MISVTKKKKVKKDSFIYCCFYCYFLFLFFFRLFKSSNGYELRIASSDIKTETHTLENGITLTLQYGDFSKQMEKVAENIKASIDVAANETQEQMLNHYYNSFKTGSIEEHIKSQEYWLQDVNPQVETNIGNFFNNRK